MKKIIGIYKITSPSGKVYIGQSSDIHRRWFYYRKLQNVKSQQKLYNSFMKYGVDKHLFAILHELPNDIEQETLNQYEQFCIDQYRETEGVLLNIREAGSSGKHSEETKLKISKSNKGKAGYWKGKSLSDETKAKISKKLTGSKLSKQTISKIQATRKKNKKYPKWSEERRLNMIEKLTGRKVPKEVREKMSKSRIGMVHSKERNEKIRIANFGKKLSEDVKKKISNSHKGKVLSESHKGKITENLKGNKRRLGNKHSPEAKNKISESLRKYNKEKCIN